MKPVFTAAASLALLAGCALSPDGAEPSWTDARLSATPPSGAPEYVARERLTPADRLELASGALAALAARDRVRLTGEALRAPTVDTAEFVVEARERALPPSLD
ncbi:MAG: hypothetical protein RKE49_08990 [Oceanicaulis sp.]